MVHRLGANSKGAERVIPLNQTCLSDNSLGDVVGLTLSLATWTGNVKGLLIIVLVHIQEMKSRKNKKIVQ